MKWNVSWRVDPNDLTSCIERDWFYDIFSLVPMHSAHVGHELKPSVSAPPYSIVCASCPNQTEISDLIEYLQHLPKPRVLYHMSDEFVEVGQALYRHCELAIRNGSANFDMFGDPNFIQIPLGYVSGLRNDARISYNSSNRKCSFAFLGTIKNERASEMLGALRGVPGPHFVRKTESFEAATKYFNHSTIAIYKNTVFVPNPKGNWNPECNRLYDALEWGCIPLIRRYADSTYHENYHDKLLGDHPIPTFGDWKKAADFASDMLSDKSALDALQAKVLAWWQEHKSGLRTKVAGRLSALAA